MPATGATVQGRIVDVTIVALPQSAVAMTFVDVTERLVAQHRLVAMAETDPLTGAWNRTKLRAELDHQLEASKPLNVALLDLDRFKQVNDSLGHSAGDLLLQVIADRLRKQLPADWGIGRLGGDEFAILGAHNAGAAMATRILEIVEEPIELNGVRVRPETSIGLVRSPEDGRETGRLLRLADTALYAAKRAGKSFVVCNESHRVDAVERDRLFGGIDQMFEDNQLTLYAQPMVELKSGEINGAEALARWVVPGVVRPPGQFLELLAMTGRTNDLTDLMLSEAVSLVGGHRFVSVNLAASDLYRSDLIPLVQRAVDATGSGLLWLEVVESEFHGSAEEMVDELIDTGARLAVDDFGAAFSSLQRIADHDISIIKLDLALVRSVVSNLRARRMVRAVIEAAHDLGSLIVAEGIEDVATAEIMLALGCDYGQGFHLGRPAPAPLVRHLLMSPNPVLVDAWPTMGEIQGWEASATGSAGRVEPVPKLPGSDKALGHYGLS